jgi:hypothetical protein
VTLILEFVLSGVILIQFIKVVNSHPLDYFKFAPKDCIIDIVKITLMADPNCFVALVSMGDAHPA